jgi:glyoxylase-like metal-dependent hydrolase (beta-lactamase superfamily II)
MTLDGTNTWVLCAPGSPHAVVVDPGPLVEEHLQAVVSEVERHGARVRSVLLTHGHPDHSEGAARFAALAGAPVRALDPAHRLGDEGLGEGDVVTAGEVEISVVATPGHTGDSLSFLVRGAGAPATVLTGDTVLGRGSTVIMHPEGSVGDYLASLRRLRDLATASPDPVAAILPGHGPVLTDPAAAVEWYLAHREQRLDEIRAALAAGARTPSEVVAVVYADVDRVLWPAAELSVRAQLAYLQR